MIIVQKIIIQEDDLLWQLWYFTVIILAHIPIQLIASHSVITLTS